MRIPVVIVAFVLAVSAGCGVRSFALNRTVELIDNGRPAFERETDFELGSAAIGPGIKMLEALLAATPDAPALLELLAMNCFSYAMIDLQDRRDRAPTPSAEADALTARIERMYLRSHQYGLRVLEASHPGITAQFNGDTTTLQRRISQMTRRDVPGLFWSGVPLLAAAGSGRPGPAMLRHVPTATLLVRRVSELDEGFLHGAAPMALGAMYGAMPAFLGGSTTKSREYFERAFAVTKRRFLMIHVTMASTVAVQSRDRQLFTTLLDEVVNADSRLFPEQAFANLAAQRRATRLLSRADELFAPSR